MSRLAQQGHKTTGNRAFGPRFGRACSLVGSLAFALPLALAVVSGAAAQSSGIHINNDVLNSLGPGPDAPAPAPLAPAAPPTPLSPRSALNDPAPAVPPAGQGPSGPGFQTYGSGNYVVTRPGTLLFPPLEAPTSTLTPGFEDNHAARTEAMNNAFAAGPEPSSQLLIPLQNNSGPGGGNDSIMVYMENLPPADPDAVPGSAPQLTLQSPLAPPGPAPRKPEVSAEMLAETGATAIDDAGPELAPEFQASQPEAPAVAETAPVEAAPAPQPPAMPADKAAAPAASEPTAAPMSQLADTTDAPQSSTPVSSAAVAAPAATATTPASAPTGAPVSLLPGSATASATDAEAPAPSAEVPAPVREPAPADLQTASLNVGELGDMSVLFHGDSAELSADMQADLQSLANSMHASEERRIQLLGFASSEGGSADLARKLALSRALKVRTFLIDAGVDSGRIQVRSLGDKTEGGPANRVDIRPIDS